MRREQASSALARALDISREVATLADRGDVQEVARLNAERMQLLKLARSALHPLDQESLAMVREIQALNDRSLGLLEHRFRAKCRDLDMVSAGRRAVRAYGTTRG
jgi:hypothetical protein